MRDARGQRGDRLLDRERRPDGRPHRRLGHRRAAADADRPPVPDAARPGDRGDPRGRGRDRRLERAVRGQPGDRRDRGHRDEPARVALVGAGLEGDRASRSPRSPPGWRSATALDEIDNDITKRTPASFEPVLDYAVVKWPRFAFEKFPGVDGGPLDAHEVGRRGDGDRAHVPAGVRQGDALARAGRRRSTSRGDLLERLERPSADRYDLILELLARGVAEEEIRARTGIDLWFLRAAARARVGVRGRAHLPRGRHLRRRVRGRDAVLLLGLGAAAGAQRDRARRPAERDDPRLGPEPDRPGDRVRLLLRARGDDRARVRPRRGDGQLQPRDRLDRLRHVRPPVLRAADARGRAGDRRGRAAGGRDRPVRRPDAAQARGGPGGGGRAAARHPARGDRPRRGPRALRRACSASSG